mgnify:FL=1
MTALARLDVLPSQCSLTAEADGTRVRFTATDADGRTSAPSGWFEMDDAPIYLSWSAFEFDEKET